MSGGRVKKAKVVVDFSAELFNALKKEHRRGTGIVLRGEVACKRKSTNPKIKIRTFLHGEKKVTHLCIMLHNKNRKIEISSDTDTWILPIVEATIPLHARIV